VALDVGTSFGGLGSSREVMIASLAEPALIMLVFTVALIAGTTELSGIAAAVLSPTIGLRVSMALAFIGFVIVAIAENARIPVDNPATHLELTMVHEAMVLEYSARHLALIEWTAALKLLLWMTLIVTIFVPFGMAAPESGPLIWVLALPIWALKVGVLATILALFESAIAGLRVFRVPEFLGVAVLLGLLAAVFLFVSQGFV
jgi:formate hydrogenlyase subunit 4